MKKTFAKKDLPKEHRIIRPGDMSTSDHNPNRYDNNNNNKEEEVEEIDDEVILDDMHSKKFPLRCFISFFFLFSFLKEKEPY